MNEFVSRKECRESKPQLSHNKVVSLWKIKTSLNLKYSSTKHLESYYINETYNFNYHDYVYCQLLTQVRYFSCEMIFIFYYIFSIFQWNSNMFCCWILRFLLDEWYDYYDGPRTFGDNSNTNIVRVDEKSLKQIN